MAGDGAATVGGVAIFCAGAVSAMAGGGGSAAAAVVAGSEGCDGVVGGVSWLVSFERLVDLARLVACAPLCDLCFEAMATLGSANSRLADTASIVFIMALHLQVDRATCARERCEQSAARNKPQERSSHPRRRWGAGDFIRSRADVLPRSSTIARNKSSGAGARSEPAAARHEQPGPPSSSRPLPLSTGPITPPEPPAPPVPPPGPKLVGPLAVPDSVAAPVVPSWHARSRSSASAREDVPAQTLTDVCWPKPSCASVVHGTARLTKKSELFPKLEPVATDTRAWVENGKTATGGASPRSAGAWATVVTELR